MAQKAPEQPAPALARDQIYVADELCSTLAALQRDFPAVKGFQFRSMRYADDSALANSFVSISIILS